MKKTKPVKNKAQRLSNALAKISNELVAVGVVDITFGELAKHILKLKRKTNSPKKAYKLWDAEPNLTSCSPTP